MTDPTTSTPTPATTSMDAPTLVSVGASAIVDNATRLGITWELLLATVEDGGDPNNVTATVDGDDALLTMVSVVGPVGGGERVYVLKVPPGGLFIIGRNQSSNPFISPVFQSDTVTTLETTASTSFTDLATAGPEVDVLIGPSGTAIVTLTAELLSNFTAFQAIMGFQVTGASTISPSTTRCLQLTNPESGAGLNTLGVASSVIIQTGLSPGTNKFTCKYRARNAAGSTGYSNRTIIVQAL